MKRKNGMERTNRLSGIETEQENGTEIIITAQINGIKRLAKTGKEKGILITGAEIKKTHGIIEM